MANHAHDSSDRTQIYDALVRYTLAVDGQNWDRLDDVFTADAQIDYSASGGTVGPLPDVKRWLAENLPLFSTQYLHTLGQVAYDFDGDTADVTAYFHNPMVIDDGDGGEKVVEVGGRYQHTFVRTPDGWRSQALVEDVVWTRGF